MALRTASPSPSSAVPPPPGAVPDNRSGAMAMYQKMKEKLARVVPDAELDARANAIAAELAAHEVVGARCGVLDARDRLRDRTTPAAEDTRNDAARRTFRPFALDIGAADLPRERILGRPSEKRIVRGVQPEREDVSLPAVDAEGASEPEEAAQATELRLFWQASSLPFLFYRLLPLFSFSSRRAYD